MPPSLLLATVASTTGLTGPAEIDEVTRQIWVDKLEPAGAEQGNGDDLNPATVLRVLGPEPWRVAYTEPSVRPDDARYGENPNRLFKHHQFQVILKPAPDEVQAITAYLNAQFGTN